jgi:hypothetical protein
MITIILEDSESKIVKKTSLVGNEKVLLCPDLGILSRLDAFSYDVFSADEMDEVIQAITKARLAVSDSEMLKHLEEIVRLAIQCKNVKGATLTFTPFG